MKTMLMTFLIFLIPLFSSSALISVMDRKMSQCKLSVEKVRIKRNIQLLIDAGVKREDIRCISHRGVCRVPYRWGVPGMYSVTYACQRHNFLFHPGI